MSNLCPQAVVQSDALRTGLEGNPGKGSVAAAVDLKWDRGGQKLSCASLRFGLEGNTAVRLSETG